MDRLETPIALPVDRRVSASTYTAEVDRADSAEWAAMFDLFLDANLYQTWSYGAVRWGQKNLSRIVVRKNGEVAAIAQLRILQPGRLPCGLAYLRWGPLWNKRGRQTDPELAAYMAEALQREYVRNRGLLLRVIPNAFAGSERAALFQSAFSAFAIESAPDREYRTCVLDLEAPLETLRGRLDKKWRNALSRAERNGLEISEGHGMNEYGIFSEMYRQMLERKAFQTTVSVKEFGRIQEDLPANQRMQTLICRQAGTPVAGIVCSAIGDSSVYLLGATSDRGLTANGGYLLQWKWIMRLKERGIRWYDLGGIDPERNPGVYRFKSGLSGADSTHISPLSAGNGSVRSAIIRSTEASVRWFNRYLGKVRSHVPARM